MTATLPTIDTPGGKPILVLPTIAVDESGNYAGGGGGGGSTGPTVHDYSAVLTGGSDIFVTAG